MEQYPITALLIIITGVISYTAWQRPKLLDALIFHPYTLAREGQWYRSISSGFIHANWMHLIFNLYVFWIFGMYVEAWFAAVFGQMGHLLYLLMYIGALAFSELPSFQRHRDNSAYRSLGASGAVSAVVFGYILLKPTGLLYLFFAIPIPAVAFGILYLFYSYYMDKRGMDNIGHSAHFFGALFGIIFMVAIQPGLVPYFFQQIQNAW